MIGMNFANCIICNFVMLYRKLVKGDNQENWLITG